MPDDEYSRPCFFCKTHQTRRAFAYLPHTSGRALEIGREDGLYGIDDERRWTEPCRGCNNRLEKSFAEYQDIVSAVVETLSAKLYLKRGFLSRNVEGPLYVVFETSGNLQQQSGLSDSRLAADENHRAGNDSAPQNKIELRETRLPPRLGA